MLLENNDKEVFLTLPVYTPTLLAIADPQITALVIRVDSLTAFQQKDLRFQSAFTAYEHNGTHLACVAFRIFDNPDDPLVGDAYLNPRQALERKALENLTVRDELPIVFLSQDATREVVKFLPWRERNRVGCARAARCIGWLCPHRRVLRS